ncbi:hypothetical protein VIGAN_11063500 [Vigna angularis var. angularis]|uniref:Uncharacterized protein n=1 Tax=Vigna angularis var. angularis TaxID=157739 RepID=A0A0S3T845_PHAAN|nr:hypothetical protein VIGAN_11063500 [Vigna angularis var. angularis]
MNNDAGFVLCVRGYNRFCNRKDLEASCFLKDDCLKIECNIGVVVTSCNDSSKLNKIQVPESDMREQFSSLEFWV